MHELVVKLGMNEAMTEPFLKIAEPPIYGDLNLDYQKFSVLGLMLLDNFSFAAVLNSLTIVLERKEGLLDRSFIAGVKPYHILIAHILVQFVLIAIQSSLLVIFVFAVFKASLKGNLFYVVLLTFFQGIAGMSFG